MSKFIEINQTINERKVSFKLEDIVCFETLNSNEIQIHLRNTDDYKILFDNEDMRDKKYLDIKKALG